MKKNFKPRCTFYLSMDNVPTQTLEKKLKGFPLTFFSKALSSKNIQRDTEVLGVFVDSKITTEVMDKMPDLKLIVALSTGYDNIDLEEAKKRNIQVCNVPSYGEITVAEHACALLLSLLKHVAASNVCVRNGAFDCKPFQGHDLQGKTIGVIGTGKIGLRFIHMLSGFGVKVIAFDAFQNKEQAKLLAFRYVPLSALFKNSDIISLHVPLLPQTKHLICTKTLSQMKKNAYLINTSRGAVVDSVALAKAIQKGTLAGAGLDVLEEEDVLRGYCEPKNASGIKICEANAVLLQHPNVLVTPHNAFNTVEALGRIFDTSLAAIIDFSNGKKLQNQIV